MDRKQLYIYIAAGAIIVILLALNVFTYMQLSSAGKEIDSLKKQQKEFARVITSEYMRDMSAAERAWKDTNNREFIEMQSEGTLVQADTIVTNGFSAVLDPADPSYISILADPGAAEPGEVLIGLGKYYEENMTRVPGWNAYYRVDRSSHMVTGITSGMVQSIAYQNYIETIDPAVHEKLGVSAGTVSGFDARTVDTSRISETDNTWLDVTEYKYTFKNTNVNSYLLIKTFVNGTTEQVSGTDITGPYFNSVSGFPDLALRGI